MLKLVNINLDFNGRRIFDNFSLEVAKGCKMALKGASGSGKTTIFNLIMHFIFPESGEIYFNGEKSTKENISDIRKKISWLPQNTSIFGRGTVEDVILYPFDFKVNSKIMPTREMIINNFERVGLTDEILSSSINEISGGEKQRIGLIISKLLKRPLMLLDEPTSALDADSKDLVIDYLFQDPEQTIISTSHDEVFLEHCQRVVEL